MKIGGILATVLGAILTIVGLVTNGNERAVGQHFARYGPGSSPGGGFIIIGIIILVVGILLLALNYLKKQKPPQ